MAYDYIGSHEKDIIGDLAKLVKIARDQAVEIERLKADISGGKVQQFAHIPSFRNTDHRTPEVARGALVKWYADAQVIAASNKLIADANKLLLDRAVTFLKGIGLPEHVSVRKPRSTYKTVEVRTDWSSAILQHIPTNGWGNPEQTYNEQLKAIGDWEKKLSDAEAQSKRSREADEKVRTGIAVAGKLCEKYGVSIGDATPDVVRDAILERDKYLRLAYWLERNRGDWSDGHDFAETGLRRFEATNATDNEIVKELWELINDWDGDGRVFRDCTWNYTAIGALADADAAKDYHEIVEFCTDRY